MNKSWNIDLVGELADEEYVLNTIDKQAVYINSQNAIQFYVRIISKVPDSFPNINLVICYATDLEKWGFEDNYHAHPIDRIRALKHFLRDNLVVFKPQRKVLFDHTEVYVGREITLLPKSESYNEKIKLIPIPVFSKEEHGHSYPEFVEKLRNRKYVGRIEAISNEPNDTPEYILWQNDEVEFVIFGEFTGHNYAHGGFTFTTKKAIKSAPFQSDWLDDSYENEHIMFVPEEIYMYISGSISAANAMYPQADLPKDTKEALGQTAVGVAVSDTSSPAVKKNHPTPNLEIVPDREYEGQLQSESEVTEEKLMERFVQVTREQGLLYEQKDLYNFHTAMKSSNLVILAGMSGTGKSKLVQAYGKALGLYDNYQMTFIPVRPSWTDDADLIGYADTLHMVYRPGDSGIINALLSAKDNKKKLHIICLDEMNLAKIEHYFSQFLSVLEMESGPRRVLRLYNEELENRLYNSAQYPPVIPIGDNVIFVGTVNLDESTYHFSDKVLDRANVISLSILPFGTLRTLTEEAQNAVEEKRNPVKRESITFDLYDSFRNNSQEIQMNEQELSVLWEIHEELQKINKNLGVGPRVVRQIDMYLKNLPNTPIFTRQDAFDLQVVQRILTKVRGPEEQLKSFLGTYDRRTENINDSTLVDILDRYEEVSDFYETRNVLTQKTKELKINGYTL
ncbi:McrB family protein [Neobacillus dielmonensis]|uniref:McrB family protein n=1 Tax=Neobacillus dielmonensis TaxID=1347369 RepID=UPI0005A72F7A|nr:AAA family ATPase [Neobacillus dielmonensis]